MRKRILPTRPAFQPFRTLKPSYYQRQTLSKRTSYDRVSFDHQAILQELKRIRTERKAEEEHLTTIMKDIDDILKGFRTHTAQLRELNKELNIRVEGGTVVKVSLRDLVLGGALGLDITWLLSTVRSQRTSDDYDVFKKTHGSSVDEQTAVENTTSAEPFF